MELNVLYSYDDSFSNLLLKLKYCIINLLVVNFYCTNSLQIQFEAKINHLVDEVSTLSLEKVIAQ